MDIHKKPESSDRTPFQDRVNVNLFFSGAQRRKVLDEVKRALGEGAAVVTITGEEGVGKSMICRMVEKELPAETFSVYLPTPLESFDDVIRVLALEVGTDNADKPVSSKILVDEIAAELEILERRLVVVFDQSERMYLATIERIRKMLDRVNDDAVLLQIVFAGRPSLLENLKQLAICTFKDAEERHFSLHPLGLSETYAYLNHCAQQHSSSRSKNVFTPEAAKKIYSMAQGNLRMTNMLAARSLEAANTDTSFMVLLDNVADEDQESGRKQQKRFVAFRPTRGWRRWAYGAAGLVLFCAVILFLFDEVANDDAKEAESVASSSSVGVVPSPEVVQEESAAGEASPLSGEETQPKAVTAPKNTDTADEAPEDMVKAQPAKQEEAPRLEAAAKEERVAATAASREKNTKETSAPVAAVQPLPEAKQENAVAAEGEEKVAGSGEEPTEPTPTGETAAVASTEGESQVVLDSVVKHQQKDDGNNGQAESAARAEKNAQVEVPRENLQAIAEEVPQEDYDEPVVFVGMKKRLPPPETDEGSAKKIVKIAPAKVKIPVTATVDDMTVPPAENDTSVDDLFDRSLARGEQWLQGRNSGSHTVQLMALTAEQAEENLKNRFRQQEYRRIADQLYIVRGNTSTVYVYYGEYEDMDAARQARNSLPVFLRRHNPYAVSVNEAIAKAASSL